MASLPRKCEHCGASIMHYGACSCPKGELDSIDAERKKIAHRLKELDGLEREATRRMLQQLGVLPSAQEG